MPLILNQLTRVAVNGHVTDEQGNCPCGDVHRLLPAAIRPTRLEADAFLDSTIWARVRGEADANQHFAAEARRLNGGC